MKKHKLAILGGGNIGTSLAKGLIRSGQAGYDEIIITDKRETRISYLKGLGFNASDNNCEAVSSSEIIVMSVKPQQFAELANDIKGSLTDGHMVLSTVTGTTFHNIESILGNIPVSRIMPNTALEICESMSCISFNNTDASQESRIISIFEKLGKVITIPEELIDASTVIGACGIAFALRFMRAMSQGGIEIGFNSELSQLITAQTVKGASRLMLESSSHPESEIDKVTTPQGITISGLNEMEHQGLSSAIIKGLTVSYNKLENLTMKSRKNSD